eukprot:scaffold121879_cov23-Tisochrysis_lutea.AAC.1
MSHQQIFAVVSCNSAQLPWPNTTPNKRPPGTPASQAAGTMASKGDVGETAPNAETVSAPGAAQGAYGPCAATAQPADASTDVP